ncbi:MAG: hypothetical protein SVW57_07700 [Thermodesulfobacteriota bacterium]|nr:hypothetical protein [Thermodesulfobacteriota bacterium]
MKKESRIDLSDLFTSFWEEAQEIAFALLEDQIGKEKDAFELSIFQSWNGKLHTEMVYFVIQKFFPEFQRNKKLNVSFCSKILLNYS